MTEQAKTLAATLRELGLSYRDRGPRGERLPRDYRLETKVVVRSDNGYRYREYGDAFAYGRSRRFDEIVAANIDRLRASDCEVSEFRNVATGRSDFVVRGRYGGGYRLFEFGVPGEERVVEEGAG